MILSRIIEEKRREIDRTQKEAPMADVRKKAESIYLKSMFKRSISRKGHINLIAEIKKSSPSKGVIRVDFDPSRIAVAYHAAGASAISVLTDERFFDGNKKYIKTVKVNKKY